MAITNFVYFTWMQTSKHDKTFIPTAVINSRYVNAGNSENINEKKFTVKLS